MDSLTLTYSLADQNFNQTKSVGIFNVSTQLLENLTKRISFGKLTVYTNSTLDNKLQLPPEAIIQHHDQAIRSKIGRIFWDQWGVYDAAKNSGNEWLFLPKGFVSFLRPPSSKLAVYIYDAIHDFYRVNYPYAMPWFENKYFIHCFKKTLKHSNVIFTDSNFTKNEIESLAHRFKIKVPLILTAGIGYTRTKGMVFKKRDSLLLLTSNWPHKLTKQGINFIERWQKESGFLGSVELVGSMPTGMRLSQHAGWRHYPRLPEETYRRFLAEAKVLLFFSAYEGFGMPPVEAMITGTCPVFSDLAVTREVMGNTGYPFSNNSYESFSQALNKALNVSETQIQLWAEQLLKRHNWDRVVNTVANGLM